MKLPSKIDRLHLGKTRYETGYNPFSYQFNATLNDELYQKALADGASKSALSIIQAGNYLHETFFLKFSVELNLLSKKINLRKEDLRELFIAFLNEQDLFLKINKDKHFNSLESLSAFDMQTASMISPDLPNNPQNFVALSEALIEFGNHFLRYLSSGKVILDQNSINNEKETFDVIQQIFHLTNKFHDVKSQYETCLFYNGHIEIFGTEKIIFDTSLSELPLIEKIAFIVLEDQSLMSYEMLRLNMLQDPLRKEVMFRDASRRVLSNATVEKGFIKYSLRQRIKEDYQIELGWMIPVYDYYPFYSMTKLIEYENLTITEILKLHSQLQHLANTLYSGKFPKLDGYSVDKLKRKFLPKIQHNVLKSYLMAVAIDNEKKIEKFIEIISTDENSGKLNLYATHLLKRDDYYYFPYYSLVHPNYLFLVDYWLDKAKENLSKRGTALEDYIRSELKKVKIGAHNKFELLQDEFINAKGIREQVDILIQTRDTLIIGEVKCVKYPMYDRDFYGIISDDLDYAVEQVNRKSQFLIDNQDEFKSSYSLSGRKIVKVIIINYPIFTGLLLEEIPIIDASIFLAYFKSSSLTKIAYGENDAEELSRIDYYTNEDEFCNNFQNYLLNPPLNNVHSERLEITENSYKVDDMPEIFCRNVNPVIKKS